MSQKLLLFVKKVEKDLLEDLKKGKHGRLCP